MFMRSRKGREADVDKLVYGCRQPVTCQLDSDGDNQLDLPRRSVPAKRSHQLTKDGMQGIIEANFAVKAVSPLAEN